MKYALVTIALVLVLAAVYPGNVTRLPPGVVVYEEPEQTPAADGATWRVKDYTITPLADYHIRARVLLTERYWMGREADLSPLDLTVGWRRLSDQKVLDRIVFTKQRRAFVYRPKDSDEWPVPAAEIVSHTANMHLIPATPEVEAALKSFGEADIVDLSGQLVEVTAPDGWRWRSSLSRTDDGPHGCELMWVKQAALRR